MIWDLMGVWCAFDFVMGLKFVVSSPNNDFKILCVCNVRFDFVMGIKLVVSLPNLPRLESVLSLPNNNLRYFVCNARFDFVMGIKFVRVLRIGFFIWKVFIDNFFRRLPFLTTIFLPFLPFSPQIVLGFAFASNAS